ncbi:hypothetical protein Tco_0589991 [Tanacetum coccineum]
MSSDSASSEVTYTSISSHGDPLAWAVDFFRLQEPDTPEAAPASPDYVPGPEEPEQAPLSPDYVPGPEYPTYLAPSDEEVLVEDQPYVVADSPITLSPGYVADSDPEEDSKDGPIDYPADGGDSDDDDSSDNDKGDEASEEEEEEHLAPADSVVAPVVDHVPFSEETDPFETDESAATPPSPLISLSPPSAEERLARCLAAHALPSSPLPIVPHPYGSPNHVRAPLGFKATMGRPRASSPSTHHPLHPSPPLPPPSSSLHLPPHVPTSLPLTSSLLLASLFIPSPVDRREDTPKAEGSLTAAPRPAGGHGIDYGFIGTLDAETRPQRAEEVGYGIRDVWVDPTEAVEEDRQIQLFQRVDRLVKDGQFHYETARLLDQEALMQDFRIASQESLVTTLITHVSSLQGQLSAALGQIQALQARGQTHANDREGAASMVVGLVFSFLVSDNHNNMSPRRSSATARAATAARAVVADAAAAPMTAAAVEQLIEARVSAELANHETL